MYQKLNHCHFPSAALEFTVKYPKVEMTKSVHLKKHDQELLWKLAEHHQEIMTAKQWSAKRKFRNNSQLNHKYRNIFQNSTTLKP